MVNAKKKGNAGENNFANWLQSHGIKAYKNSSSGGNEYKSDIHNDLGLNIEVKTVKRINLQEAWKQSERDADMAHTQPLLAIHFNGMRENEWLIVLHSEDWVELIKNNTSDSTVGRIEPTGNRELKWALENLKSATTKAIKLLDNEVS